MRRVRLYRPLLCGGLAFLVYLMGLGRPPLWEPDEGRYAEVAREMVVTGDYVTPRNDWVRYFEKPPLVYWATAASLQVFGRNEFAVRLQAASFSAAEVGLTAALGEAMLGAAAGILGALALALSPLFFVFARFATPDPALAFFLAAGLGAFYLAARTPDFGTGAGRRWMIAAAAMLGLGTLAKGPVALALGGAIALLWLIFAARAKDAMRIPWLSCIAIYVVIAMPWYVLVSWRNPGFLTFFLVHEHLQRYLESTEHGWGPWFFVPVILGGTFPWLCFVPAGIVGSRPTSSENVEPPRRADLHFLLIWFAVIFIFFSIPRSKLGEYILPALPPIAILAGAGLANLGRSSSERRRSHFGWVALITGVLVLATGVAAPIATRLGTSPALAVDAVGAAAAIFGGAAIAYLLVRRQFSISLPIVSLSAGVIAALGIGIKARSDVSTLVSYRELARASAPYVREGCVLASYRHFIQALPFYTGARERIVRYEGELAPFSRSADASESFLPTDLKLQESWGSGRCVILIANRTDLRHLRIILKPQPSIVGCEGKKFALLNQARPAPAQTAANCGSLEDNAHRRRF